MIFIEMIDNVFILFLSWLPGRVLLVRHRDRADEKIALKVLDKQVVIRMKQVDHTLAEKKILQALSCPFIVKLLYTFKDNSYLYLGLEYAPGGEMFTHLRAYGRYTEDMTRFYAAQIVLAFEYLHHLGVVCCPSTNFIDASHLHISHLDLSRSQTRKSSVCCWWIFEDGKNWPSAELVQKSLTFSDGFRFCETCQRSNVDFVWNSRSVFQIDWTLSKK